MLNRKSLARRPLRRKDWAVVPSVVWLGHVGTLALGSDPTDRCGSPETAIFILINIYMLLYLYIYIGFYRVGFLLSVGNASPLSFYSHLNWLHWTLFWPHQGLKLWCEVSDQNSMSLDVKPGVSSRTGWQRRFNGNIFIQDGRPHDSQSSSSYFP